MFYKGHMIYIVSNNSIGIGSGGMETLKAIAKRKSTRAFSPGKRIDQAELDTILAAGCAAPVGRGDYPSLHLTVIQDAETLEKINKVVQETLATDQSLFYNAPVLVLVSASEQQVTQNIQYANTACIVENMLLAATDFGIGSVFLWKLPSVIADNADLCEQLNFPDGFKPVSAAAFGYAIEEDPGEKELSVTLSLTSI